MTITIDPPNLSMRAQFRALITSVTGIQMPESKQSMIEGRMRRRITTLGIRNFDDYLDLVFAKNGKDQELPFIVDLMSTNKTDFFREPAHFDLLMNKVLPGHPRARAFKLWSAASSSGEEAYTSAMVLSEFQRRHSDFVYAILGTDIADSVLKKARLGIYSEEILSEVPDALRERYVIPGRDKKGRACGRITAQLRQRIRFESMNLVLGNYPVDSDIDVALLRNVLIYFDDATQQKVVSEITDHIRIGGYLFVGHSETMVVSDPRLKQVAFAVFKKERA